MTEGQLRERAWLEAEVERAAGLSDADRIRILRDLLAAVDAIRKVKSPEDLEREESVRLRLDLEPGRARYRALVERLG